MPQFDITLSSADQRRLERARSLLGFASAEQAAEWLIKRRLQHLARQSNGRGRALYMLPRSANAKCAGAAP